MIKLMIKEAWEKVVEWYRKVTGVSFGTLSVFAILFISNLYTILLVQLGMDMGETTSDLVQLALGTWIASMVVHYALIFWVLLMYVQGARFCVWVKSCYVRSRAVEVPEADAQDTINTVIDILQEAAIADIDVLVINAAGNGLTEVTHNDLSNFLGKSKIVKVRYFAVACRLKIMARINIEASRNSNSMGAITFNTRDKTYVARVETFIVNRPAECFHITITEQIDD